MSFLLRCPNCGLRDVAEFRYGGQIGSGAPDAPAGPGSNLPGAQFERWFHRLGCRRWLTAERDLRTNTVLGTGWLTEEAP
jgi:heterotetrameric sarcosine oxidase delta subunit